MSQIKIITAMAFWDIHLFFVLICARFQNTVKLKTCRKNTEVKIYRFYNEAECDFNSLLKIYFAVKNTFHNFEQQ